MSWPKRLHAAHGPMLESADAREPTGPSRPVALHTRGYASGLPPRFGTGVVVGNSHAIHLANTAVNQVLAAQQAPRHRDRSCYCGIMWQTHRTARLRGRSPRSMA